MAIAIGPAGAADEEEVIGTINTTPLVDVMLVLLIIFLITIPVVIRQIPLQLPKEANQPLMTTPENITISVNTEGEIFWNEQPVPDIPALVEKLKKVSVVAPQPEVHIRGDEQARYEFVGRVVVACQRAGIIKLGFILEPPARG